MRRRDLSGTQENPSIQDAVAQYANEITELQEIYEDSQKDGYTVTDEAYEQTQRDAQQALIDLGNALDALIDDTDVFYNSDGDPIDLPLPALERGPDGLPQYPGGN